MPGKIGPIGRLGRYTATHFRLVVIGWVVVAVGLGFLAPRVESALSGGGADTEHTFTATGDSPAEILVIYSPPYAERINHETETHQ
jgi:hypothetical protein